MKEDSNHKFYLVREDILPEAIKKTIKVKEILKHHQTRTINEAVRMMDLSRSAYYKYKDYVFPFYDVTQGKIVTLSVMIFGFVTATSPAMSITAPPSPLSRSLLP